MANAEQSACAAVFGYCVNDPERYGKSPYGQHLKAVADGKVRY